MTPSNCQTPSVQSTFHQISTFLDSFLIPHLSFNPVHDFPTDQICFTKALMPLIALLSRRLGLVLSVETLLFDDGSAYTVTSLPAP